MGIRTQFFYLLGLVTYLGLLSNLLCFLFSILKFIMITSCSACVATLLIGIYFKIFEYGIYYFFEVF